MQLPEKSISDWRNSKGYTTGRPIINSAGEKPVALLGSHLKICKALWRTVPSQLSPNFSAQNIISLDQKKSINELIALISTGAIETVQQCLDFSPLLVFYNRSNIFFLKLLPFSIDKSFILLFKFFTADSAWPFAIGLPAFITLISIPKLSRKISITSLQNSEPRSCIRHSPGHKYLQKICS